ncbi:uncharacterized protein TNCV_2214261 [Trichonephila clavipes]|nr:uncharacterized protein TNCV_2214261 [Trichonephila clavipes]
MNMKRNENFQMLPKELHQLKYESISVPHKVQFALSKKHKKEKLQPKLITKGVTSLSPVPQKTHHVGERCTLNWSRALTSSCWSGEVVKRGQLKCRPRHLTMVQNYEVRLQRPSCS